MCLTLQMMVKRNCQLEVEVFKQMQEQQRSAGMIQAESKIPAGDEKCAHKVRLNQEPLRLTCLNI